MPKHMLICFALSACLSLPAAAQHKRQILPRDSITQQYCYQGVSDLLPSTQEELRAKLQQWAQQNYNALENKFVKLGVDGDSYTMHDREALPGKARKYVAYDLTVDLKDNQYRYKLTNLQYTAVGTYPLEDRMATDKRSDLEEIDVILRGIIASMEAALKSSW